MKPTTRKLMAYLTAFFVIAAVMNFASAPRKAHSLDIGGLVGDLVKIGGIAYIAYFNAGELLRAHENFG